jgi:multiple sugar transport system substrate-binding protein/sn-glycerol 3-phosphate transport system substrate-binding protein
MSKKFAWLLLLAFLVPALLGACATATEAPPEEPVEEPVVEEPSEPEEPEEEEMEPAVDPSGQTVVFWHVWGEEDPSAGLLGLIQEFNETNEWGITVEGLDQGRYSDLEDAMNAAIQSGDVPNILVGYTNALDTWYSVDVMADINTYIYDEYYGLTEEEIADFYPGVWANGVNAEGARVGFPHGQSANVLFYNFTWAQELGFPAPPATAAEFKEQACASVAANDADDNPDNDGTGGLVSLAGASNFAAWVFAFGGDFTTDDGSTYDFVSPEVVEAAKFLKDLWDEGCAWVTESYPNPEFASRQALFAMSSTAGYPYQANAFEGEGAFTNDVWGFIPYPGPDMLAVDAYAQNTGIVRSTPEQELASWLFIKWFTSPEVSVKWIDASGYHPIRASVPQYLDDYIAENPLWAEGIDLVPLGVAEPGFASYGTVRRDIGDTLAAILQGDAAEIEALLADLDAAAQEAFEETS